jgi:ABC-type uncharacterized transport system substrate-binding protein
MSFGEQRILRLFSTRSKLQRTQFMSLKATYWLATARSSSHWRSKPDLPTTFSNPDSARAGGLIAYGPNIPALFRGAADQVDKILRGANPGDLPVEQPTKFDLVLNVRTAKVLGLTIPDKLLALADEVIE